MQSKQTGQKAASAAEASRGYFGHNFPMSTLASFVELHRDGLTEGERELIGACVYECGWVYVGVKVLIM